MPNKGLLLSGLALVFVVVFARAMVKVVEPRILFHPSTGLEINPSMYGIDYVDAVMDSGGYRIHGWFMPGDLSGRYVIFYHGNAGNMADRLDFIKFLKPLDLNIFMIDYRGYGRSEGYPTIEGVAQDAIAAYEWLSVKRKVPPDRIVLWGRSLGVAVALATARRHPGVAGVILESGFVSMRRIAMDIFPYVPVFLVTDGFDNGAIVAGLKVPKLVIHGMDDKVIPFSHAEELFARSAKPKLFVPISNAGHNNTYSSGGAEYLRLVGDWITKL